MAIVVLLILLGKNNLQVCFVFLLACNMLLIFLACKKYVMTVDYSSAKSEGLAGNS